jgi:hypothetical protein
MYLYGIRWRRALRRAFKVERTGILKRKKVVRVTVDDIVNLRDKLARAKGSQAVHRARREAARRLAHA